jgi:cytosine/adenosine deaminase-related metal-dependent hydrolase
MAQPHLYPANMPLYRVAYFANGNDVETVIVNGDVLMLDRQVQTVNVADVLHAAQNEIEAALERTGLQNLVRTPESFWGESAPRQ